MIKPAAALVFVTVLFALLSGCGSAPAEQPVETPPVIVSTAPIENPDFIPAVKDGGIYQLPLAPLPVTFRIFASYSVEPYGMRDNNDSEAYEELWKRTGIFIEWTHFPTEEANYAFMKSLGSGDLYDAYMLHNTAVWRADEFITGGVLLDLGPYIPEYAPNYQYLLEEYNLAADVKTQTGRQVGFWQLLAYPASTEYGPFGRADWLEKLGLDMPDTYDELHDALAAIKENYLPAIPLALMINGVDDWLTAGFGTRILGSNTRDSFLLIDGKVVLGATLPGAKEYVQTMAQWYAEGLIDTDFIGRALAPAEDPALVFNEKIGVGRASFLTTESMLAYAKAGGSAIPAGLAFTAFPIPVKKEGDTRKLSVGGTPMSRKTDIVNCISTRCAQPEVLVKWFDYLYTDEGAVLANYGTLADGHTMDDIGKANITEMIFESADSIDAGLARFAAGNFQACLYDPFRAYTPANRIKMEAVQKTFDANWADEYTLPASLKLTESEAIEYDLIMADVETYLEETFVRLITGEIPMSEYDAKLAKLDQMNYKRAEEHWQTAYERYLLLAK